MSEKPQSAEQRRRQYAVAMAQAPAEQLARIKGQSEVNPFITLLECRAILHQYLTTQPDASVANVDSGFIAFYQADNARSDFYEAAVHLLQRAGYSREEVGEACADFLRREDALGKEAMMEKLTELINNAVAVVYDRRVS